MMFVVGRSSARLCPHLEQACSFLPLRAPWKYTGNGRLASCRQTHASQSRRSLRCCSVAATEEATETEAAEVVKSEEKSFSFKFLVTQETASFIERDDGTHLAKLQKGEGVSAELSKPNDKAVRSLILRGTSPSAAAAFLDKLLLSGEEAGQEVLPTTQDGSRLRMRAMLPSALAGFLLGTGGKRLMGIASTTDCFINIAEATTGKQSSFRLMSFAGSHQALVQAVKIVLTALCEDARFFRVPNEKAFITVPKDRVSELNLLLVDIRAKARSKVSTSWVKVPASLKGQPVKQLLLAGRPAAVQQAKQQVEDILASPPAPVAKEISTVIASVEQAVSSEEQGSASEGEAAASETDAGTPTQDDTEVGPISGMEGLNPSAEGVGGQEDVPKEILQETAAMPS